MSAKILVVDDSRTVRASVKYTLTREGYEVILAEDGKDGFEKLEECFNTKNRPSLIFSDINMPNIDGLTFIKNIKANSKYKFIPVIVLTTESQQEMILKGKEVGAAGWLIKPFQPEQLVNVVKKFVR